MRLFFAVNLPDDARARLHRAAAPLRDAGLPVRWVPAQNLHVTLRFLGEVPERLVARIREAGAQAAAGAAPFDTRVSGVGAFPDVRRPRVLWIGVADAAPLRRLNSMLEQHLAPLGFAPEERAYHPHVTLGRVRERAGAAELRRFGELAPGIDFEAVVPVRSLDLMRSDLGSDGARYERIGAAPLG